MTKLVVLFYLLRFTRVSKLSCHNHGFISAVHERLHKVTVFSVLCLLAELVGDVIQRVHGIILQQQNVHVYGPHTLSVQQTVQFTPLVLEHTLSCSYCLKEEFSTFSAVIANHYNSAFFCSNKHPSLFGGQKKAA